MKRGTPPMTLYYWAYGTVVEAALTNISTFVTSFQPFGINTRHFHHTVSTSRKHILIPLLISKQIHTRATLHSQLPQCLEISRYINRSTSLYRNVSDVTTPNLEPRSPSVEQ